ncbi:hypothetical protein F5B21DRAFT_354005 [Xylaria acuta]|nr:hypothetical protein F5B21DRAFT_354005 [Xylaria acuta]
MPYTADCINDLEALLADNSSIAQNVTSLNIYHAAWPKCGRSRWQTHPLLFGGEGGGWQCSPAADRAYRAYKIFWLSQRRLRVADLESLLLKLPRLNHITIEHVRIWSRKNHPRYIRLRKSIWLEPHMNDPVDATVDSVLQALASSGGCSVLQISGNLSSTVKWTCLPCVSTLVIASLRTIDPQCLLVFLASFPKLKHLSLEMPEHQHETLFSLQTSSLPGLETLELRYCQVPGHDLAELKRQCESLLRVCTCDVTLVGANGQSIAADAPRVTFKVQDPGPEPL